MDKTLLFGAAYYPEYLPSERMDEDIDMMMSAGMNVVRIAESTWSTLEPEEGIFNFSYIDRVIEKTEAAGMMVIIGTPTYAVPPWLVKKDPDILVDTKDGRARYGYRQLINLLNHTYRNHAEKMLRKLAAHTADKKNVIGYQIDNEAKHHGNMGKEIQKLFLDYLKQKFITTDRFNDTFGLAYWSNSISSWDDLPDLKGCINGGLMSEFEKFQRSMAADFLKWQADIISDYKRSDQFITNNLGFSWKKFGAPIAHDGYSYGVQRSINFYEASQSLTLAASDIYHPTQDQLTGADISFGGDVTRSLKDNNYLVMECQAQAFKYWTPYPDQLKLHAFSHLASGALGILYWNWHSIHCGYETYWKGLLSHDLKPNPPYYEACEIGKSWKKLSRKLCGLKKSNKVALIVDNHSMTAFEWFPIDKDLTYNDVVRWMYDSLYEMNIECDVVDINALDISKYKVIITPALYCITEEKLKILNDFVKDGGVLISSFKSFITDEYVKVFSDTQPHHLQECFGINCNQYTYPGTIRILGHPVKYLAELLIPDKAESLAEYEHKYWGNYSGITRHNYGNGVAYYIGCYTDKSVLKDIYKKAFADASIPVSELTWPVTIKNAISADNTQLHFILHYSSEEREFTCPYESAADLISEITYQKGDAIRLKDWDVLILEEKTLPEQ